MSVPLVALLAFTVVMVATTALALLILLLRQVARRLSPTAEPVPEPVPPETLAVLTAAASEALGVAVRLHRVHVHRGPVAERWSRAGRMDIMISHRVEPRR